MKKLLIAAAAIAFATPALAATDGNLSTSSSTGSLDVTVNIPKMVRVSGLQDMTFNITPAMLTEPYFSREDQTDTFCVYSNDGADGAYSMTVTSSHSGDAHHHWGLTGAGGTLPFAIWTSDTTNQFKTYNFGQTVSYLANGDGQGRRTTLNCSDHGNDASIKVGFDDADLLAAQAGAYTGTVTVTVSTI
jgi:hypothetical protein